MGSDSNNHENELNMVQNPAEYYGKDLRCISDADELFSECEGIDVVVQDAIHRLTTDHVLGPNGVDWGYDCRKLLGASERDMRLAQPIIAEVLSRDDRVLSADVTLDPINRSGVIDATLTVTLYTETGPFTLTRLISDMTDADLENLPQ